MHRLLIFGRVVVSANAAFGGFVKFDQFLGVGRGEEGFVGTNFLQGLGAVESAAIDGAVEFADYEDFFGGKSASFESDFIDHANFSRRSFGYHEWGNVLAGARACGDHGMGTDAAELVNPVAPGDYCVVADMDVPGEGGMPAHHDVVAEDAVVGDMGVGEEVVVIADDSEFAVVGGWVDGDVFAEDVVVADMQAGDSALVF